MTSEPLAVLVLAAALLTLHREPGSGRLHDLFAGTVDTLGGAGMSRARRGVETVGPVHRVAGGVGLGLLAWALTGAVPANRSCRRLEPGSPWRVSSAAASTSTASGSLVIAASPSA